MTGHAEQGVQTHADCALNTVLDVKEASKVKRDQNADSSDDDSEAEPAESDGGFSERLQVVRTLLGAGADFKAANKRSETVLHYAALGGHGPTITTLLVEGADLKLLTGSG